MKISLLSALIIYVLGTPAFSQQVNFKKEDRVNAEKLSLEVDYNVKKRLYKITLPVGNSVKSLDIGSGRTVTLQPSEELVHVADNGIYKIRYKQDGAKELIRNENGVNTHTKEFAIEELVEVIDESGNFISNNSLDGNVTVYFFYSPEFEQVAEYRPFGESGANYTKVGYSDEHVCILSQEGSKSTTFKLAIFDHSGKLIAERELPRQAYEGSDLKVVKGKVILLSTSSKPEYPRSKIQVFDQDLTPVWQKTSLTGVANYKISVGQNGNSLALVTHEKVSLVNTYDGTEIWNLAVDQLTDRKYTQKIIANEYVIDDQFIAINVGELQGGNSAKNDKNKIVQGNVLTVLDIKTGRKVFSDRLADMKADQPVEIISGSDKFLVVQGSNISVYRR